MILLRKFKTSLVLSWDPNYKFNTKTKRDLMQEGWQGSGSKNFQLKSSIQITHYLCRQLTATHIPPLRTLISTLTATNISIL